MQGCREEFEQKNNDNDKGSAILISAQLRGFCDVFLLQEQAGMEVESMYGTALRSSLGRSSQSIPEYNFEVKTDGGIGGIKLSRARLQVNVDLGRLVVMKGEDATQYKHDEGESVMS